MKTKGYPFAPLVLAFALCGWMVCTALMCAAAADHALIEKLPQREAAAKRAAHQEWDSGVTSRMLAGTERYNNELAAMIAELVAADYQQAGIHREEVASYVKAIQTVAAFRHKLDNPSNEDRGTLDQLDAPSAVSTDLENTIEQMVKVVADGDRGVDYGSWKKRWDEAKKTGDTQASEPSSPTAPDVPKSP